MKIIKTISRIIINEDYISIETIRIINEDY